MNILFAIVAMICAVLLILVIVVQNSKGGGLSSTFGASNLSNMIGNRRAAQDIEKFTWYLISGLFVISFVAAISVSSGPVVETESFGSILEGVPPVTATQTPPNTGTGINPGGGVAPGGNGQTPPAQP